MIANISSSESSFEETLNTLKYANRAKNIRTTLQRNVMNVNFHISEYVHLIDRLRAEIKVLKDQIGTDGNPVGMGNSLARNASLPVFSSQTAVVTTAPLKITSPAHSALALAHGLPIFPSTPLGGGGGEQRNLFTPSGVGGGGGGISLRQPNTPLQMIRDTMKSGKSKKKYIVIRVCVKRSLVMYC
jgi:hypothetical protein